MILLNNGNPVAFSRNQFSNCQVRVLIGILCLAVRRTKSANKAEDPGSNSLEARKVGGTIERNDGMSLLNSSQVT